MIESGSSYCRSNLIACQRKSRGLKAANYIKTDTALAKIVA